jgi:hypothetical protein
MRLPRPHVPISVKLAVAERQLRERGPVATLMADTTGMRIPKSSRLKHILGVLFGNAPCHLDHDPPLMLRYRTSGGYVPEANDPNFMIWRTAENHRVKTYVRGDGAQLSDAGKRRKEIRRRKKTDSERIKYRWPKGRKLRSRPLRRAPP